MKRHPRVYVNNPPRDPSLIHFSEPAHVIQYDPASTHPSLGAVLSEKVEQGSFTAKVMVEHESLLLLKVSYHPNLAASVSGIKTNTVMVMPGFTGVSLPPGTHEVSIEYQPRTLRKILLCLGFLTLILILLCEKRSPYIYGWFNTTILSKMPARKRVRTATSAGRRRRGRR